MKGALAEWLAAARGSMGGSEEYFKNLEITGDRAKSLKLGFISTFLGWVLLVSLGVTASLPLFVYAGQNPLMSVPIFFLIIYQIMWLNFGTIGHPTYVAHHAHLVIGRWSDTERKETEEVYAHTSPIMAVFSWIPVVGLLATFYQVYSTSIGIEETLDFDRRQSRIAAFTGFILVNLELLLAILTGVILAFV